MNEEWLDNIVVLEINVGDLDANYFEIDPYFRVDKERDKTFIYNLNIPPEYLREMS